MKPGSGIPEEINIGIYRIAQEALNNALKYSNASEIKLSLTEFDDYIGLYMRDNGNGFNKDAERGGTGILNMQERARSLNGAFQIETSPHGTAIEVEIPLPVITLNLPEVL
jgi:signal transduction histidine kinase